MNFEYSQDQKAFQESVIKFLQQEYSFEERQKIVTSDTPFNQKIWQTCAELGWLTLLFDEEVGGFGGSAVDCMMLFEELGKHLVVEPFTETLLQFGGLIQASNHPQRLAFIDKLIAGELQGAFAHTEPYQTNVDSRLNTSAEALDIGYQIQGVKSVVYNAPSADWFVVSADLQGQTALFLVPAKSEAISLKAYTTVDGRSAAELTVNNLLVPKDDLLAHGPDADAMLETIIDHTLLAQVAEMVGAMRVLLDTTVEYTKERKQFGAPLASFQVLQHKMVEMLMASELARSLMYAAAIKLRDDTDDARFYVAAAKVKADKCARLVAQNAVQLHGGIGTTDEYKVGHYLKHVEVLTKLYGPTQSHVYRYQAFRRAKPERPM